MKKIFLTGALAACLLLTGCGKDVASNNGGEKIDFHANDVAALKTYSSGTDLDEVTEETTKATKESIDWSKAPHFNNFDSLIEYLNDCKKNLQTWQPVVCDGFTPDAKKILSIRNMWLLSWTDYGNGRWLYQITNYPGERVAWAYTHNDKSFLNNEEKQLYDVAVQILNDAKSFSSEQLYQELYIHDRIADKATYYTEDPQPKYARFQTALGALIDGKANCQGYSDAFYMLATMCGLTVDKVGGIANGGFHTWNSITFGNESYFVDVTWNDENCTLNGVPYVNYIYFNAPTEVAGSDHQWYTAHVPKNMQRTLDGRNFYRAQAYGKSNGRYFGAWSETPEDALGHIAYRIAKQGYNLSWSEAPYDSYYENADNAAGYVLDRLTEYGWYGSLNLNLQTHGNHMYITAKATKS